MKDIAREVTSGCCSGQQVFQLSIGGGKKAAFAARTHGLGGSMKRMEPANSTQGSRTPSRDHTKKTSPQK